MKEIIDTLDFITIKNIWSLKGNVKRMRSHKLREKFAKESHKGLLSKIYKKLLKLNNKETAQLKNGQRGGLEVRLGWGGKAENCT